MSPIQPEIDAFKAMQSKLEAECLERWVLFYKRNLIGDYSTFDAAADVAVEKFGKGPFLIRQVGAKPHPIPASLAFARPSA